MKGQFCFGTFTCTFVILIQNTKVKPLIFAADTVDVKHCQSELIGKLGLNANHALTRQGRGEPCGLVP
jgi:hypothetical protein